MRKSFKTEINPSEEQKIKIRKTIGTCRFIYNFYLAHNKELYNNGEKFMSSNKFRVWLNNEYLPQHPEYSWIKEAYSKAVTQAVNNGQTAFTRFFNHESAFPNFKKKGRSDVKMYFVKNNPKDCRCERHRINIPSLGWVRIKEKGYIQLTTHNYQAQQINDHELSLIKEPVFSYKAEVTGIFPEYSYPTDETLMLKKGAQIMFVKNDPSPEKRYYNGMIGEITSIDEDGFTVRTKEKNEKIIVQPEEWTNSKYVLNEETKENLHLFTFAASGVFASASGQYRSGGSSRRRHGGALY